MLQQWDYMTLQHSKPEDSIDDLEEQLKSWGGRGWELVGVVQTLVSPVEGNVPMFASSVIMFMKRPLG
jgi:hypothetical protein